MYFTSILTTCKSGNCKSEKWTEISNHKAGGPWLRLWQWIVAALLPCLPTLGMAAGDKLELKSTTGWDLTKLGEFDCSALSQNTFKSHSCCERWGIAALWLCILSFFLSKQEDPRTKSPLQVSFSFPQTEPVLLHFHTPNWGNSFINHIWRANDKF